MSDESVHPSISDIGRRWSNVSFWPQSDIRRLGHVNRVEFAEPPGVELLRRQSNTSTMANLTVQLLSRQPVKVKFQRAQKNICFAY